MPYYRQPSDLCLFAAKAVYNPATIIQHTWHDQPLVFAAGALGVLRR
jgi:hypothetical protein